MSTSGTPEAGHASITEAEFEERVQLHQSWVSSVGQRGQRLSLFRTDLRPLSVVGLDLLGCELSECELSGLDLTGADLHRGALSGCGLDAAKLVGVDLNRAELPEVTAAGARLDAASLADSWWWQADLRGASLRRCYLLAAGFDGADLRDTSFEEADFDATSLDGTILHEPSLTTAFRGARGTVLPGPVTLEAAAGQRREVTLAEVLEIVNANGAHLRQFDQQSDRRQREVVPWRWEK